MSLRRLWGLGGRIMGETVLGGVRCSSVSVKGRLVSIYTEFGELVSSGLYQS